MDSHFKNTLIEPNEFFDTYQRFTTGRKTYTSKSAAKTKSIDYFVRLKNGKVGKIEFFFGDKYKPDFLFEVYEEI